MKNNPEKLKEALTTVKNVLDPEPLSEEEEFSKIYEYYQYTRPDDQKKNSEDEDEDESEDKSELNSKSQIVPDVFELYNRPPKNDGTDFWAYYRHSGIGQDLSSQAQEVRAYCEEKGLHLCREFADFAKTGTSTASRHDFERMITESGIRLIKFYFSISKEEQAKRFEDIKSSPIKKWKYSAVDKKALELWDSYTNYKNKMFKKTNTKISPWIVVKANRKTKTRIEAIEHILNLIPYNPKDAAIIEHVEVEEKQID